MEPTADAKPRILIVDDSRVVRLALSRNLSKHFEIIEAEDGLQALQQLETTSDIRVVFSDLAMPRMDGYEFIERLRGADRQEIRELPVVVVTGADESETAKEQLLELGATDLIRKPFDGIEVKSRALAFARFNDRVSELRKHQSEDPVTGLLTGSFFLHEGERSFSFAKRHGHEITVIRLAMDRFPLLSAALGEATMRKGLRLIGNLLQQNLRKEDSAAYLGENEFALTLPGTDPEGANHALRRISERAANINLKVGEHIHHVDFCIGITSHRPQEDPLDFSDLMKIAENAVQTAIGMGPGKTVRLPAMRSERKQVNAPLIREISIDMLISDLGKDPGSLTAPQLFSAMRRLMPLLQTAQQRLDLGLEESLRRLDKTLPK
jgi:diguanylate cyclase (GGDEF)-like protein